MCVALVDFGGFRLGCDDSLLCVTACLCVKSRLYSPLVDLYDVEFPGAHGCAAVRGLAAASSVLGRRCNTCERLLPHHFLASSLYISLSVD